MNKVAICQSSIIPGGRLRVLLGMAEALNEMEIEPDVLTSKMTFRPDEIEKIYGKSPRVNFRRLPYIRMHPEFSIILFNAMLNYFVMDYDLIINTSNSLIFLPKEKKAISYVFYPRESRIRSNAFSIHNPEKIIPPYSPEYFLRMLLRRIYRGSKLHPTHQIVSMTEFTKSALESVYPITSSTLPVIYPPVEVDDFKPEQILKRGKEIATVGRFTPDKRQLEQIRLAAQMPDFNFHIVGFVANQKYYKKCELLVENLKLGNVHLHPNTPFSQMIQILHQSRYFLHTLIDEPFGITAVQAIAAGCMPIVHDSGGQREVVPYTQLRYKTMGEIQGLIERLENEGEGSFDKIRGALFHHVTDNYNDAVFQEKMKHILNQFIHK